MTRPMKITLSHKDIFALLKKALEHEGRFEVPEENVLTLSLRPDDAGNFEVELEVGLPTTKMEITPNVSTKLVAKSKQPPAPVEREENEDPRTIPGPPPPPPTAFPNEEVTAAEMAQLAAQSEALRNQKRNLNYTPARNKFPTTRVAATIEEFGKDPEDMRDEIS